MKASEVLRAEKRPQAFDGWAEGEPGPDGQPERVCAAGCLWPKWMMLPGDKWVPDFVNELPILYPEIKWDGIIHCQVCFALAVGVEEQIFHLNDEHRWTFGEIADWLETFEVEVVDATH